MREATHITPIRAGITPEDMAVHTRAGITGTPEPETITRTIITMARTLLLAMIGCAALFWARAAIAQVAPTDDEIRHQIVLASVGAYLSTGHPCACPYNSARNGSSCGGRSAYSKAGGAAPLCYIADVSDQMVAEWKQGRAGNRGAEQALQQQPQVSAKQIVAACVVRVRNEINSHYGTGFSSFDAYIGSDGVRYGVHYLGTPDENFQFQKCMSENGI